MEKCSVLRCLVATILFLFGTANAFIWYVHPDSTLNSIQDALNMCTVGDTVLVGPGTYNENIIWPYVQGIDLRSEYGPDTTIIDGTSSANVIRLPYVDTNTVIDGFTICNGNSTMWLGGGIACNSSASPCISRNIILNNYAPSGGGIACTQGGAAPIIRDNIITGNTASDWGGGIYCRRSTSSLLISQNNIVGNHANYGGGGIACMEGDLTLISNIISNNNGGGIFCGWWSSPSIDSCTIAGNNGDGIHCEYYDSSPAIHHCNINGNTGFGVRNMTGSVTVNAEDNWWGDVSGPYHPTLNPGGLGDSVSDYVDFEPWLTTPVGVEERPIVEPVEKQQNLSATIFRGPLQLSEGKKCKVFDITGRIVEPDGIAPGVYFLEIDNKVVQKVIKIK
jgi:hypothetical protein